MSPLRILAYHANRTEFTRYFCAGSLTFLADFTILLLLTEVAGVNYLWSNLVSVSFGIVISYLLCIWWVFSDRRYNRVTLEFPLFVLTCMVGILLNELLLWGFVELATLHYLQAKIVVTLIVFVFNYGIKKMTLFTKKS